MDLRSVMNSLSICYDDWSKYIINPNFIQNDNVVTWGNRKSGHNSLPLRLSDVQNMEAEGQYTFVIEADRSLIQLFYRFDSEFQAIIGASLGYYSTANDSHDVDQQLMDYGVVPTSEVSGSVFGREDDIARSGPEVGWFRLDYDPDAKALDVTHALCHLHLSGFPRARVIVSGIPTPRQFVEFVFCSFYPSIYRKHRLQGTTEPNVERVWNFRESNILERVNREQLLYENPLDYRRIVHFRVPD